MKYLDSFTLASADEEAGFVLSYPAKLEMQCYSDSAYPFKIFPQKKLRTLRFEQITLLYGGNGSGKSTLLNVIAEKLSLERRAPFNYTPLFEDYLAFCSYVPTAARRMPVGSAVITSDDVFDFLLDLRAINAGVDRRREALFEEYDRTKETKSVPLRSLEDYDALKRFNRENGVTVVMISSELEELRQTCDRIAIVSGGRIAGILPATDSSEAFGALMVSQVK